MKTIASTCIGILCVFLCEGCQAPPDPTHEIAIEQLPVKRIERETEWRDACRVDAAKAQTIHLGEVTQNACLRLGVLDWGARDERSIIRVYLGNTCIRKFRTAQSMQWTDHRIPLEGRQGTCRLVITCPHTLWLSPCEIVQGKQERPNVLIFLIDALRQDHLHCYGYARETSPNLDVLAQEGILFAQLMPQSSWTKPSVGSLLTSTYPHVHGAQDRPDVLHKNLPDLALALQKHGYDTHGLITNPNVLPLWGFGDGFAQYVDVDSSDTANLDDAKVVDAAIATIDFAQGRPWFLYVHAMGPHAPYEPPEEFRRKFHQETYPDRAGPEHFREAIDLYDGEIAYSDTQFARVVNALKTRNLYDNTLIIVLSDHGEEFGEHGGNIHGRTLYEEVLRVPLIIRLPRGRLGGERRESLVEMVDIAPMILDILGLPPEDRFQGRSFKDLLETGLSAPRMGYASLVNLSYSIRAVRKEDQKYIRNLAGGWESWFDLIKDPGERYGLDTPPLGGEAMRNYSIHKAAQGGAGLHILMTCGEDGHQVTGTVTGISFGPFELSYYDWKGETHREGDAIHFSWRTKHPSDQVFDRDTWHTELAEQDHAHLRIEAGTNQNVQIRVDVDGRPISPDIVHVGAAGAHRALDGTPMPLMELLADTDAHDPAGLPREFAIYIWYVADAGQVNPETMDPALRESLKALGYLN
ncbi:MAG TPA: sulfatase [Candidatus Hydrogenedentes bacterium]|nr:sulfatase [Candidatus Hydrogenedentota bacterium]